MPISWTAENDRLLLLKLIETHGISVDATKIAAAWPDDQVKPTARAIKERFVKLRQLCGIKVSMASDGGSRPRQSKFTTPKKRKTKRESDESDADHYLTEEDTPSKPSAKRTGPRGRAGRKGPGSVATGSPGVETPRTPCTPAPQTPQTPGPFIKAEPPEYPDLPSTVPKLPPFTAPDEAFERDAASIREHSAAMTKRKDDFNAQLQSGFYGAPGKAAFLARPTAPAPSPLPGATTPRTNGMLAPTNGTTGLTPQTNRLSVTPAERPARERPVRKASAQASEGFAAFLRQEGGGSEDEGEPDSGEDSQASEYHDLDDDYV